MVFTPSTGPVSVMALDALVCPLPHVASPDDASPSRLLSHHYGATLATVEPLRKQTVKITTATRKKTKISTSSSDEGSSPSNSGGKPKKLSTERSRLCRQRQKLQAEMLETTVAALRAQVAELATLRDLRREQLMHSPSSQSGSLARAVREYCSVFEYGLTPETGGRAEFQFGKKRSFATSRQLTAQQQCDFLLSMMDPDVQVYDWIGRTKTGPDPLIYGWKAWSTWHASIMFRLEGVDIVEANNETIAVSSRGKICVKVSRKTIEQLFPHVAGNEALCLRLLGSEIQYPFRDTFFFNEHGRVCKYTVDLDCITAINNIVGDFREVANILNSPDDVTFSDRAVSTYDGCSLDEARLSRTLLHRDQRLELQFLLS